MSTTSGKEATAVSGRTPREARADRSTRSGIGVSGWLKGAPFILVLVVAAIGLYLVPHNPERVVGPPLAAPSGEFWFGTDSSGFDVFSRTIAATRNDVMIALLVAAFATVVGILIGLLIGMNEAASGPRGRAAHGTARLIDLTEAVPGVILGLVALAFFGASFSTMTIAIGIMLTPVQVRLVRTEVLRVRSEAYLDAARMMGMSEAELSVRHVLPNSIWSALEYSSVVFAVSVITTASLGFIGVGLPPPTPEWGLMLSRGATDALIGRWWPAAFPAIALASTVASVAIGASVIFGRRRR